MCCLQQNQGPSILLLFSLNLCCALILGLVLLTLDLLLLNDYFQCSGPIDDGFCHKGGMTDLNHYTPLFWICDLFKIRVSKKDFVDHQLFPLRLNVVANIVRMFSEDENTCVAELEEDTTESEG